MPDQARKPIHEQPELCGYILGLVGDSSVPMRIAASQIPGAGSGLFAVDDVAAGDDIFRSQPLLVVSEGHNNGVCDYCFVNKNSAVAQDGRFYMSHTERNKINISACTGCKSAQYCSKECQRKDWRAHHKYECPVVNNVRNHNKDMGALPQALCRLILWIEKGAISKSDFDAIVSLETHYDARNDQWQAANGDGGDAPLEPIFVVAHNVRQAVKSNIGWSMAAQLYCMLLTNAGGICPAEAEVQYGSFLDLLVSMINHSCDANAHVFFEGRELRCRALKDIAAGTEITVNYFPTPRTDVLPRRSTLVDYFFIECSCKRCKDEMAEHIEAAVDRRDHLAILKQAQQDLQKLSEDAEKAFRSAQVFKTCIGFHSQICDITERGYPTMNWPYHIEPLPSVYVTLGGMYRDMDYMVGLEFLLKGTLYSKERAGPTWVRNLEGLVKSMFFFAQAKDDDIKWRGVTQNRKLLQRDTVRDLARGYLSLACVGSKATFGLDSNYARAMHDFAGHAIDCPLDPKIDTEEYRERFESSQARALEWGTVKADRGLALPSRERIAELRRDIDVVLTKKVLEIEWPAPAKKDIVETKVDEAVCAMGAVTLEGAEEQ